jgi:hypothetical protein
MSEHSAETPNETSDAIEELRAYVLQRVLGGATRTEVEEELIGHGYETAAAIALVESVMRNRPVESGAWSSPTEPTPPLPDDRFEEARRQMEAMTLFALPPGSARAARQAPQHNPLAARLFLVLAVLGSILAVVGLGYWAPFWFLWFTGDRATGRVTQVEDIVVPRPFIGPSKHPGKGYDLKATYLDYTFPADGKDIPGNILLDSTSNDWSVGTPIDILYSRSNPRYNTPASFAFRWDHDTVWVLAHFAALVGVVLATVGLLGRRRHRQEPRRRMVEEPS